MSELKFEVKPPKVPMIKLLEVKYLQVGQIIYGRQNNAVGKIEKNGYINDGEQILSIHKMSAKQLGLSNYNGWDFFKIEKDGQFITLDSLRYDYQKEFGL